MYPVSDEYTELMDDDRSELEVFVECDFGDGAIILDGEVIEYIDLNERVNDNSNILTFGSACSQSVAIKLREPPELQYKGLKCKPRTGIALSDGTIEWVPLGTFWVDTAKTHDDYKTVMITAYDKMYRLNGAYKTSLQYPALIADVVAEFEALTGVNVVEPTSFPALYITKKVEDGRYTCRDMAGHLAGCLGKNATFNRDGDMEFIYYKPTAVKAVEDLQYMDGFEKLADNALKVNFLVTGQVGQEGEIELENDGTDPGALDWSMFDVPEASSLPLFTFVYNEEARTASVQLTAGYESREEALAIPTKVVNYGVIYTVTSIPANGFEGSKATKIYLPSYLETVGERAFGGCTGITEITIPESVTSLAYKAFQNCTNLTKIYLNAKSFVCPSYSPFVNIGDGAEVIIGDSCTIIPAQCFRETNIGSVVIGNGVKRIEKFAFSKCTQLTSVVFGSGLQVIVQYAFNGCTGLTSVVIPDSVTTIDRWAFQNCSGLTYVQIGKTAACAVSSIGSNSFTGCAAILTITLYKPASSVANSPWGASNASIEWVG